MITEWFVKTWIQAEQCSCHHHLHRITDNNMTGTTLKNLQMFANLCGQDAMPNVIVVMTRALREQELKSNFWNSMVADLFNYHDGRLNLSRPSF